MFSLSSSLTEIKTEPDDGNIFPAAICDFRNAMGKFLSIPITSPVDFISGPSIISSPGNRSNGKKGNFFRRATQERQPHFELTHFLKSYCLCTTYIYREREGESKPQIEEEMWTALVGSIAHARTMNRQQIRAILSKTHSSLYFDHAHERLMFPSSTQSAIPKRKRPVIPSEGFL